MEKITNIQMQEFLQDFEATSELYILDEGKEKNELVAIAKTKGINLRDNRDLSGFKTIYTFANKANANKARLPKEVLLKALPSMIGKPVDIDHNRRYVVGHYIDYRYIEKGEMVVAYGVFYKSNFGEEWDTVLKLFASKKLTTSYEIWCPKEKRRLLPDGTYELLQQEIAGGAILFKETPAFEDAKMLELAKQYSSALVDEMVYAKTYCSSDIIIGGGDVACVDCGKCKHLPETADIPPSKVQPPITIVPPLTPVKITCFNCQKEFDITQTSEYKMGTEKCPNCFAILKQDGTMIYPPQIIDFHVLCPSCQINKWLILSKTENDTKVKCLQCSKEYEMTFTKHQISEDINKLNFVYSGMTNCYQCNQPIDFYSVSSLKQKEIKCHKCGLQFLFDTSKNYNKKITKISEIDNKLKSSEKGGPEMKDDNVIQASEITEPVVENKEAIVESQVPVSDTPVETVSETPVVATTEVLVEPVIETPVEPTTEVIVESIPETPVEAKTEEVVQAQEQPEAPVEEQGIEAPKAEETTPIVEPTAIVESKCNKELKMTQLLERYKAGVKRLAQKCRDEKKKTKQMKHDWEESKVNAVEVARRRLELGDKAIKLSDVEIMDDNKFTQAKADIVNASIVQSTVVGVKPKDTDKYTKLRTEIDKEAFGKK